MANSGTEFHGYIEIELTTGVRSHFATPRHPWERGTYRNTNGLTRQYVCQSSRVQRRLPSNSAMRYQNGLARGREGGSATRPRMRHFVSTGLCWASSLHQGIKPYDTPKRFAGSPKPTISPSVLIHQLLRSDKSHIRTGTALEQRCWAFGLSGVWIRGHIMTSLFYPKNLLIFAWHTSSREAYAYLRRRFWLSDG